MTKILMPVDGSEHDIKTASVLGKLFKSVQDIDVTVLHVANLQFPFPPATPMGYAPTFPSSEELDHWEKAIKETASEIVERGEKLVRDAGLRVTSRVAWGHAAEMIIQAAEQEGVDLIAIGSRGAGQVKGLLLGSVSNAVAHRAQVPVLIVH